MRPLAGHFLVKNWIRRYVEVGTPTPMGACRAFTTKVLEIPLRGRCFYWHFAVVGAVKAWFEGTVRPCLNPTHVLEYKAFLQFFGEELRRCTVDLTLPKGAVIVLIEAYLRDVDRAVALMVEHSTFLDRFRSVTCASSVDVLTKDLMSVLREEVYNTNAALEFEHSRLLAQATAREQTALDFSRAHLCACNF